MNERREINPIEEIEKKLYESIVVDEDLLLNEKGDDCKKVKQTLKRPNISAVNKGDKDRIRGIRREFEITKEKQKEINEILRRRKKRKERNERKKRQKERKKEEINKEFGKERRRLKASCAKPKYSLFHPRRTTLLKQ